MKNKFKYLLPITLLFTIIFCMSCENQETYLKEKNNHPNSRFITFDELKKNQGVFGEYQEVENKISLAKNSNQVGSNSKLIYLSQYNFIIDTDKILLIEKGDYKSYTFPIYKEEETGKTENLVITEKNNLVNAYLTKYTLTDIEKEKIENKEYVDLMSKTEIEKLQNQTQGEPCYDLISIPVEWNDQGQVTVSMVFAIEVDCADGGGGDGDGGGDGSGSGFGGWGSWGD